MQARDERYSLTTEPTTPQLWQASQIQAQVPKTTNFKNQWRKYRIIGNGKFTLDELSYRLT